MWRASNEYFDQRGVGRGYLSGCRWGRDILICGTIWTRWDAVGPVPSTARGRLNGFTRTSKFWRGDLHEQHLARAEELAKAGRDRRILRGLHGLRGEWRLERGGWAR